MDGMVTLRGRVGSDLTSSRTRNGTLAVRFRLAVSQWRRTDQGHFEDLGARWYTIRAWDRLAQYTLASVRKGDPVVLVGRPTASAWTNSAGEIMSDLAISAHALGHDLSYGTTTFFKYGGQAPTLTTPASSSSGQVRVDSQATPADSEFRVPLEDGGHADDGHVNDGHMDDHQVDDGQADDGQVEGGRVPTGGGDDCRAEGVLTDDTLVVDEQGEAVLTDDGDRGAGVFRGLYTPDASGREPVSVG